MHGTISKRRRTRAAPVAWTPEAIELVINARKLGKPDHLIAQELGAGYSESSVYHLRRRIGCLEPNASRPTKRVWRGISPERLIEKLMASAPVSLTDAEASVCHLIDLKRAGHSPRYTELNISHDDGLPWRHQPEPSVLSNSPAAAVVEG